MTDEEGSEGSFHSDHYADRFPELVGQQAPFYKQLTTFHGFKRQTMADLMEFDEAYPGATETVRGLNPEIFQFTYGSQIVNIKTEFVENIHHAIREKMWTTLETISKRINMVWNARREPTEKVFFLFSINGQKQYCGLAEVCGPWSPDTLIEGWTDPSCGFVGSFPLTWIYVKNVPYARFAALKHGEKNQSIANMWSGQTISPSEPLGREVIKIFVESSHHSNILAWPKAQGGPLGASRSFSGSVQPLRNMRATRGGHTGQHGRDSGRAIDRDWRANENNPRTAGRIIGEIDVNQPASIATRRNAMQLTVNSAPLPQTDGAFESARTPRPGQIVSCVVDENGALVPVTPEYPQTANPMKHMTDHQYFSRFGEQTLSVEDLRGNSFGDLRGGRRGGLRGGRSPIIIQHNYFGTDKQVGLGINNHQGELHHAESSATIKSQHPGEPSTSSGSSLKHAAFAAEFVPMSDANRSLKQTGTGKKVEFEALRDHHIHHASSSPSFVSQHQHNPAYVKRSEMGSQNSYPSHFRSADSMAGYVRPVPGFEARSVPYAQPAPRLPMIRNLGAKTPTHLPKDAELQQKTEDWIEQTPRHNAGAPTAIDGAAVPIEKRATFYHLMANKAEIEQKLAGMSVDVDAAQYYRTMAKQAEVDTMLTRLTQGKDELLEGPSVGGSSGDGSIVDGISASSINVRAEDGRTLPSASDAGKPGRRAAKHQNLGSWDARVVQRVDELLESSPESSPESTKAEPHGSPVDSRVETIITNPFSDGDGHGGICLE
ncbi:hypothetical protein LTR91_015167 [Friedmanniomyces endolithicus]|uniref:YTH domain-containing protein n=1 Tax=Friedmanniomyces endolithicus TaxID=329885 RepID=A0AAN6KAF6_9PEZI|nr:hypothetical protein LTR94_000847 [Friedmanniomyces endolithicus]KAK0808329.1 hypothetical protein LTR59_002931 [Friedmanniomyces endolithicus]KAK0817770.1 hypothetical protein LTR38_001391 [Friedmanniomyces endolithicus]KAK0853768.1 hypothetical protein LTR03_002730 [Friedmanniomyces endolithicus]KAK0870720.1 hypothetical protein LTS02_002226 [Friedmanniomyces endolithicus]